ncbi:penicillin acylase family protein [Tibeticola sp.]|uniref:penicillin acylase family protein n=1 Tax=Tibeticola sp. TaxID=2005368 RepID=UPI002587E05C|nr:penicillin acylase family protein [Tibeticola sp.]MCI4439967.1 penicillin acylase family protein [Tibeticola sp.]
MRRWMVRLGVGLGALVVLSLAVFAVWVQRSLPLLDGRAPLHGLQAPVEVWRDASDVTHIEARSAPDAWRALGWVHAQERGWQLEFNRRVMHGELSEILGEATLPTDRLLRGLGIMRAAQAQYAGLPAEAREALAAYAEGINAYHAQPGVPLQPEFRVLGVAPGRWTPEDSVGWALMMALDLGGNWGNEFARLSLLERLPTQRLWELMPAYEGEKPATVVDLAALYQRLGVYRKSQETPEKVAKKGHFTPASSGFSSKMGAAEPAGEAASLAAWAQAFVRDAGTLEGKGSNNWVVAGSHSTSGKPLLANDPHLGLSAPAIWYFAHLRAPESRRPDGSVIAGVDAIGATFPGLPFVVIGRTAGVAWGVTNTGPDVQDLYLEQINPDNPHQYRTPSGWADFTERREVFKVKGKPDVVVTMRETRHGPVLSDAQDAYERLIDRSRYAVALRWSALDADNHTVVAGLASNRARNVPELLQAFSNWHSPMQNAVFADTEGRIGYKAIGRAPLRRPDNDIRGVAPSPGWEARYDWSGWIGFAQTPQDNPAQTAARGWIATANERITPEGYPYFMGQDWHEPYRAKRIAELLSARPKHDLESLRAIQADQHSAAAIKIFPWLERAAAASKHPLAAAARRALEGFDGVMAADRAAPAIHAVWADELTRALIEPRIGTDKLEALYGKRHFRSGVEGMLARKDAYWCGASGCDAAALAAFDRALERLRSMLGDEVAQWQWGRIHEALSVHRPLGNVPALARFFDVRVPTGGDNFTVNVGQYWPNDAQNPFANRHAASLRLLHDLSDPEQSRFIYQTGQSGLVFSDRYRDMREEWAAVQYRPLQRDATRKAHTLTLEP